MPTLYRNGQAAVMNPTPRDPETGLRADYLLSITPRALSAILPP